MEIENVSERKQKTCPRCTNHNGQNLMLRQDRHGLICPMCGGRLIEQDEEEK